MIDDVESSVAWGQTEGGLAVIKVAQQMNDFEKKWISSIPEAQHIEFMMQLSDLVQAARLAGQKETEPK